MKFVLTLAAILASASQSTTDQPYELKGEAPGMTLKQFKANHRHADCSNPTSHQSLCRVYDDVSFAGQTAATFKHCATLECGAQGLSANFVDGRLVYLMNGGFLFCASPVVSGCLRYINSGFLRKADPTAAAVRHRKDEI
jgi:hypothetical protein